MWGFGGKTIPPQTSRGGGRTFNRKFFGPVMFCDFGAKYEYFRAISPPCHHKNSVSIFPLTPAASAVFRPYTLRRRRSQKQSLVSLYIWRYFQCEQPFEDLSTLITSKSRCFGTPPFYTRDIELTFCSPIGACNPEQSFVRGTFLPLYHSEG